ncbi:MAG: hypothetical protein E6I93_02390 [Chloroflexi bacterium]|nr:MAG: hypothetical protein E6I93_02390 [Chloroflexota bacterium]
MSIFLSTLLNSLQSYGYPALWLSIFVAAVGLPLPIGLVLLAAGAFAALGDFNVIVLALIATSASVAGDCLGYLIGRLLGSKPLEWLEQSRSGKRFISPRTVARSRLYFKRRGGWAIFLSRFLFSALGGIINLLSGIELFPFRYFLFCDIPGEAVGVVIPLALGFAFGASWEAVGDVLGAFSLFVVGLLLVIVLLIRLIRYMCSVQRVKTGHRLTEVQNVTDVAPIIDPPAPSSGHLPLS